MIDKKGVEADPFMDLVQLPFGILKEFCREAERIKDRSAKL